MKIKWLGKGEKLVELPIPFESKSAKVGEVLCNPIGEFDEEYGEKLLEVAGEDGLFVRVDEEMPSPAKVENVSSVATVGKPCECGCGGPVNVGKRFIRGHAFRKKKTVSA